MRSKQSLNGLWDYRIGKGSFTKQMVPYSALPVGESECCFNFDAQEPFANRRAFLIFDGITYAADVTLNDTYLGKMLPYSEYRFEVTSLLKEKDNHLSVKIYDCDVVFGPSEGWENYSGIIRGVWMEYTEDCIITETLWHTEFSDNYTTADCFIDFKLDHATADSSFEAILKDASLSEVARVSSNNGNQVQFRIQNPQLWSPDTPYLYTLECRVLKNGDVCDVITQKVGFKELITKGKRFYLNGEPLFLLGVNRHDMFGDHGHTLTEEEMVKDMQMIKDTGVNYVRLVHYPHHKRIIEIADEIGLLVSEEPGLWWSDMHNPEICDGALEVLRRIIYRDRNHVSIAFWLSFNECNFTLEFLKDSARVSRECDPYHMVSGANCMSIEMTKENFPICGFDFYTMHPYGATTDRIINSAQELTEMPLLFTEWGGFYCYNNPHFFRKCANEIIQHWNNPDDQPVIAGAVFWCWAEMYELSRGYPACTDGILREGLVDKDRNPNPDLDRFRKVFSKLYESESEPDYQLQVTHELPDGKYLPIPLPGMNEMQANWVAMIETSKIPVARFCYPNKANREMQNGPKLPCEVTHIGAMPVSLSTTPYVVAGELEIPIDKPASKLHIIGNVSMPKGFPIEGAYGEPVCEYIVTYADGTTETHTMKNGRDITTATGQHGPSRINPVAETSPRVLLYNYDFNFEHYLVNLHTLEVDSSKQVQSFTIKDLNNGYHLLFYGITIE